MTTSGAESALCGCSSGYLFVFFFRTIPASTASALTRILRAFTVYLFRDSAGRAVLRLKRRLLSSPDTLRLQQKCVRFPFVFTGSWQPFLDWIHHACRFLGAIPRLLMCRQGSSVCSAVECRHPFDGMSTFKDDPSESRNCVASRNVGALVEQGFGSANGEPSSVVINSRLISIFISSGSFGIQISII